MIRPLLTWFRAVRTPAAVAVALAALLVIPTASAATAWPVAGAAGQTAQQGAAPSLSLSNATLPGDQATTVTVTGRDYLVPPHAPGTDVFGGVYVFFGWVADPGHFGPSIRNSSNNDGTFGATYAYPGDGGDPSTRGDMGGAMRFVSFTAGGESGSATDYHMDENGNWSTSLVIFGASFATADPVTGETRTYDCTEVQCGVYTIGAHGNASATNEKFTPINFAGSAPSSPLEGAPRPSGAGQGSSADGGAAAGPSDSSSDGASSADPSSAGNSGTPGTVSGPGGSSADEDETPLGADPVVVEHDGSGRSAPTGDGEALALGVSHVRATGSGTGPLVATGVVGALSALATAWWWRRRRRRAVVAT